MLYRHFIFVANLNAFKTIYSSLLKLQNALKKTHFFFLNQKSFILKIILKMHKYKFIIVIKILNVVHRVMYAYNSFFFFYILYISDFRGIVINA